MPRKLPPPVASTLCAAATGSGLVVLGLVTGFEPPTIGSSITSTSVQRPGNPYGCEEFRQRGSERTRWDLPEVLVVCLNRQCPNTAYVRSTFTFLPRPTS